jgi:hypothetical protein
MLLYYCILFQNLHGRGRRGFDSQSLSQIAAAASDTVFIAASNLLACDSAFYCIAFLQSSSSILLLVSLSYSLLYLALITQQ